MEEDGHGNHQKSDATWWDKVNKAICLIWIIWSSYGIEPFPSAKFQLRESLRLSWWCASGQWRYWQCKSREVKLVHVTPVPRLRGHVNKKNSTKIGNGWVGQVSNWKLKKNGNLYLYIIFFDFGEHSNVYKLPVLISSNQSAYSPIN